ncbi:Retrovirus-related Pol polyprotein from transposon TNT 1-94 [Vitis vinifera]|uniref:Retrovirus-related Pol polyprotein from transposon TNT 1-94 n=1 Tax=Vitis vinifera TaxID=29760 RepID=A0A438H7Y6_VITVI|nr:Retrovirus-related Pol polyprotein from transposon TNT 1-94 [Vitis vinifera]
MDVKSAFLNGILNEEVYVEQSKGFQDPSECALDFAKEMKSEFEMSMVGELTYFLGFQVKQLKDGIFLSQSKYITGTLELGPWYPFNTHFDVACYIDVDWAGNVDDRKTTSGGCFYIGNCLVAWMSKKQNSVSLSTTKAKYIVAGSCCSQLLWIKQMLRDYRIDQGTMVVFCDNTSAINISKNLVLHSRTNPLTLDITSFVT